MFLSLNFLYLCPRQLRIESTRNLFYVDSGAGQYLSSCSTAFLTLEPCSIEVVGVAGSLPIFGRGTAIFALSFNDIEILVRVHNLPKLSKGILSIYLWRRRAYDYMLGPTSPRGPMLISL